MQEIPVENTVSNLVWQGGSLAELETQVLLSHSLGYLTEDAAKDLLDQAAEVGRLLGGLLRSLSK